MCCEGMIRVQAMKVQIEMIWEVSKQINVGQPVTVLSLKGIGNR